VGVDDRWVKGGGMALAGKGQVGRRRKLRNYDGELGDGRKLFLWKQEKFKLKL
jgi:hypothetical protein